MDDEWDENTVSYPIRFGSIAWPLGKEATQTATHRWMLFVRGEQNEPLPFVRQVEFHLHESFPDPVRVVTQQPFEIHDSGWGEFQVKMVVCFIDPKEEPVVLVHTLRLFPLEPLPPAAKKAAARLPKGPVVSDVGEEIVFSSPSDDMAKALKRDPALGERLLPHPALGDLVLEEGETPNESEIRVLKDATSLVRERILKAKAAFDQADEQTAILQAELDRLIREKSVVYGNDEIVLWKPEHFRHVPMVGEHDHAAGKRKKLEQRTGVNLSVSAEGVALTPVPASVGGARKKKARKSSSKKKKH